MYKLCSHISVCDIAYEGTDCDFKTLVGGVVVDWCNSTSHIVNKYCDMFKDSGNNYRGDQGSGVR